MEQMGITLDGIVADVACAVITLLAGYAVYGLRMLCGWIKTKISQIQNADIRQLLTNALEDVERLTGKTVSALEQTAARELRAAVKDGNADAAQLAELGKRALDEIVAAMTPQALAAIEEHYGDAKAYIGKCIETKVLELKGAAAK